MGRSYNRRSEELDKYIGKKVRVTFFDDDVAEGILEYDVPEGDGLPPSALYSVKYDPEHPEYERIFFRKSHSRKIEFLEMEQENVLQREKITADTRIKTVSEVMALAMVPVDMAFCIGIGTAYVFIGTAREYEASAGIIESYYGRNAENWMPISEREIKDVYMRHVPGEQAMLVFIIEGNDEGRCWLKSEYDAWIKGIRATRVKESKTEKAAN